MIMEFIHKVPSVEAYNKLRVNSGMNSTKPNSEVKKALEGIKLWESLINGLMKIHMRVVLLL